MTIKQVLVILLGGLLLSISALADTTPSANCAPFPETFPNGNGGPSPVSCPAFTVAGGTLTGVQLTYRADYQFGSNPGPNSVDVTFVPAGPGGVTWGPASLTLTVTGGPSSGAITTDTANATGGISAAAFAAAFNVNISSAITQGTVATSSGAVSVIYTYTPPPPPALSCPTSSGTVGTPYNSALVASSGVPPYTLYQITSGSLPPVLILNGATGAITGTPTTAGVFNFTAQVTDSIGGTASTPAPNCTITIGDIPPPPPGVCSLSAANIVFPDGTPLENSFLIRYAANLDKGDSIVNVSNSGLLGAPLLGPGFGDSVGNICVNVYTFSPDEQLISCCSCPVTPNGLAHFSVNNDLLNTTLTGVIPTSTVIKLVASVPGTPILAGGMLAWGTTLHAAPAGGTSVTEGPFRPATLSPGELASLTGRCASILGNGSGFGICRSCRAGALGAAKQ